MQKSPPIFEDYWKKLKIAMMFLCGNIVIMCSALRRVESIFWVKQFPEQYENEGDTGRVLIESPLEKMAVCIRCALHFGASKNKTVLYLMFNNEHSNFYFLGNSSEL